MPRLVRRAPLAERLKAYLNPLDFLLYVSEEIATRDWDTEGAATAAGLGLNLALLLARANSGGASSRGAAEDDVFGDGAGSGGGWLGWFASLLTTLLTLLSLTTTAHTLLRKRHYRLFESPLSAAPPTPSASRVRVASPPPSPLRRLRTLLTPPPASARAHPDPARDVWELSVWDPPAAGLRLFCLFSPGHAAAHWLFLPLRALDPRPSVAVATMLAVQVLLSAQLLLLTAAFSQQAKDTAIVHREVLREYDTKFVHPALHPVVRDVGTQFSTASTSTTGTSTSTAHAELDPDASALLVAAEAVTTYPPTTILRRGWTINPNPNYAAHISPDAPAAVPPRTPVQRLGTPVAAHTGLLGMRQPQFRPATPVRTPGGAPVRARSPVRARTPVRQSDGGSLGVYSHAKSPLKKATSAYEYEPRRETPRNGLQAAAREIAEEREGRERRRKTFM